jgi:hypothetical protein
MNPLPMMTAPHTILLVGYIQNLTLICFNDASPSVNIFFLFDSIAYFIGYLDFVLCLRQVLLTGTIPESHASTIS